MNRTKQLIKELGFKSIKDFKQYMKSKAKLNEYGAICYTEKRHGLELTYSDNCKHQFMIGGNNQGIFSQVYL